MLNVWAIATFAVVSVLLLVPPSFSLSYSLNVIPKVELRQNPNENLLESNIQETKAQSLTKSEKRQIGRAANARTLCIGCTRPPAICICDALPEEPFSTATKLLILQHPRERRRKHLSTVPLLRRVLRDVKVVVGSSFKAEQLTPVMDCSKKGEKPLFLYPTDSAMFLEDHACGFDNNEESVVQGGAGSLPPKKLTVREDYLIVIMDGTWVETKRMIRASHSLVQHCSPVQFKTPPKNSTTGRSIYDAVRKEPNDNCLSTLEAYSRVLELLEPSASTAIHCLHKVLELHVNSHLVNACMMAPGRRVAATFDNVQTVSNSQPHMDLISTSVSTDNRHQIKASGGTTINDLTLPNGAKLRSLQPLDAHRVDSWWEYRSSKSLPLVKRRIERDGGVACLGIEVGGSLVASILRYEGGALGMLYVVPWHRRKGYGSILLRHATQALQDANEERVAFIVDGNHASEALFSAAGWEHDDPSRKRKTGRRRAKRKWVHRQ